MSSMRIHRRGFIAASASCLSTGYLWGQDAPAIKNRRATSGDQTHYPNWKERLTITVGTQKADLVGNNDKVLQAAVDYIARAGGGTVKILPGVYKLRNAIQLASGVRILGSGAESIITKIASKRLNLSEDSDWYDQEVTLEKADGFRVGDGVCLITKNPHNNGNDVLKRTLVARSGNRFKLNKALRKNFWLSGKPTISSLFPLFSGEELKDVVIENLTFDGNGKNNENFNGNYGGCIFLQDCNRIHIKDVETKNYNGDGISWQICHDVKVENCHSHDNSDLGLHPGSGSQRPVIQNNRIERNNIGIFWCWGVKFGLAEKNRIDSNRSFGISIGHNDTDNVMRDNDVLNSGKTGVLFRNDARGKDFWPNRNVLENNRILNSGDENGIAIDIQGKTREITLHKNKIRETRNPMNRVGIKIAAQAGKIEMKENTIEGFAIAISDARNK